MMNDLKRIKYDQININDKHWNENNMSGNSNSVTRASELNKTRLLLEMTCKVDKLDRCCFNGNGGNNNFLNYLKEEIETIIANRQTSTFIMLRVERLLEQIQLHFGPHPENLLFQRFLRIALKNQNFFIAIYLLNNYIKSDLISVNEQTPDLLFYTLYSLVEYLCSPTIISPTSPLPLSPSSSTSLVSVKSIEIHLFILIVQRLIKTINLNIYYRSYRTTLLTYIIENIEADYVKEKTLLSQLFEKTFEIIIENDRLNVNHYLMSKFKYINPLQNAINQGKHNIAKHLLKRYANIDDIEIKNICFITGTSELLKLLYFVGYKFPLANELDKYFSVIFDDDEYKEFKLWLNQHQHKQLPLICLSWNVLRNQLKEYSEIYLPFLCENISLPDEFIHFAKLTSFEITEK